MPQKHQRLYTSPYANTLGCVVTHIPSSHNWISHIVHIPFAAKMTRLHNNANVLALGGGMIGKNMAIDILETFLNTEFSEGENHIRRIGLIE